MTRFFVVAAPGHYGNKTVVMSSHKTIDAARKAAKSTPHVWYVVRRGHLRSGWIMLRAAESVYPIVR
jgi:hypothetical protein